MKHCRTRASRPPHPPRAPPRQGSSTPCRSLRARLRSGAARGCAECVRDGAFDSSHPDVTAAHVRSSLGAREVCREGNRRAESVARSWTARTAWCECGAAGFDRRSVNVRAFDRRWSNASRCRVRTRWAPHWQTIYPGVLKP